MSANILICDDADYIRNLIGEILRRAGYEVAGEASSGREAVDMYQRLRPDLVTMDILMPDMSGIDAVHRIRDFDPQARILMCSAMGQSALVQEALKAGATGYVVKPFQASGILEAVRRVLG